MEEILKTVLLEYEKSTFLIDLIKHSSNANYVGITQTIEGKKGKQELKINLAVLPDIISALQNLKSNVSTPNSVIIKSFDSEERQKELVKQYYKGLTIESLALVFDCTTKKVVQILTNKGIEIVDNKLSAYKKKFWHRKRKR